MFYRVGNCQGYHWSHDNHDSMCVLHHLSFTLSDRFLAAHSASPATATALMYELNASQPMLLQRATRSIPDMLPKAYRWVKEMEEISEFVGGPMGDIHKGMASVYTRVDEALKNDGDEKRVLEEFVEEAKKLGKKA